MGVELLPEEVLALVRKAACGAWLPHSQCTLSLCAHGTTAVLRISGQQRAINELLEQLRLIFKRRLCVTPLGPGICAHPLQREFSDAISTYRDRNENRARKARNVQQFLQAEAQLAAAP